MLILDLDMKMLTSGKSVVEEVSITVHLCPHVHATPLKCSLVVVGPWNDRAEGGRESSVAGVLCCLVAIVVDLSLQDAGVVFGHDYCPHVATVVLKVRVTVMRA